MLRPTASVPVITDSTASVVIDWLEVDFRGAEGWVDYVLEMAEVTNPQQPFATVIRTNGTSTTIDSLKKGTKKK